MSPARRLKFWLIDARNSAFAWLANRLGVSIGSCDECGVYFRPNQLEAKLVGPDDEDEYDLVCDWCMKK